MRSFGTDPFFHVFRPRTGTNTFYDKEAFVDKREDLFQCSEFNIALTAIFSGMNKQSKYTQPTKNEVFHEGFLQ